MASSPAKFREAEAPKPATTADDQLTATHNDTTFFGIISASVQDITSSPLNLVLLAISFYLLYRIYQDYFKKEAPSPPRPPPMPKMPKRDFTLAELRPFTGTEPDGRILIAINGKVFDVTRGRGFYGPGGAYDVFAGKDASRGLATFALDSAGGDTYDDLSDLTIDQMSTVRDWEAQFLEKYDLVGRLLKPGEVAHDYTLDEEEATEEVSEASASPKTSPDGKKIN